MQEGGLTADPFLLAVTHARKVNSICGFGAVTPWSVGQLDEAALVEIDALYEYEQEQKELARAKQNFDSTLAARRARHPSYRK